MTAMRIIAIAVIALGCSSKKTPPPEPKRKPAITRPKLERSEPLPALARQVLRERMVEHGDDMESLLWTVLMLDYDSAASIADRIGKTAKISRPTAAGDPTTLNAALPQRFFDFQDELYNAAAALHQAAVNRDDGEIAAQYARISRACIGCHSLYLKLPKVPEK